MFINHNMAVCRAPYQGTNSQGQCHNFDYLDSEFRVEARIGNKHNNFT